MVVSIFLLSACSEVQKAIDTGQQVISAAQGLSNVCSIAEETWTTDVDPKEATAILKRAVKELEKVISENENLVPDSRTLLRDLNTGISDLEKGLTKKELKEAVSSIQSICSGLSTE